MLLSRQLMRATRTFVSQTTMSKPLLTGLKGGTDLQANITSVIRPQIVNFFFTINDVKKVDSENHEIIMSMGIYMEWGDSRISCKTQVGFVERFELLLI